MPPVSDLQHLTAAQLAIAEAEKHLAAVAYEHCTYHVIKCNIDGARDLLLQATMNIEQATQAVNVAGVVGLPPIRFDEEKPPARGSGEPER